MFYDNKYFGPPPFIFNIEKNYITPMCIGHHIRNLGGFAHPNNAVILYDKQPLPNVLVHSLLQLVSGWRGIAMLMAELEV